MNNNKQENKKKPPLNYARFAGMGLQMGVIIAAGVWGGIKLDQLLALKFPVFTLVLTLLSVFLAIYYFIKDVLKK